MMSKCATCTSFWKMAIKVKVTLRYRGREMAHQDLGRQLLERVAADTTEHGKIENFPKMERPSDGYADRPAS